MIHQTPLIATLVATLGLAFVFGTIANRLRLPTIVGYLIAGVVIFLAALLLRYLVRRSSHGFLVSRALHDAEFYRQVLAAQVLTVEECSTPSRSS